MNMEGYREVFLEEAEENIGSMNSELLVFEKNPRDLTPVDGLFRAAHTLKGMSATMGYDRLAEFTHALEDALDRIRSGSLKPEQSVINLLYKGVDAVQEFVSSIKENNVDYSKSAASIIDEIRQNFSSAPEAAVTAKPKRAAGAPSLEIEQQLLLAAEKQGLHVHEIEVNIAKTCAFKNVRAFMVVRNLSEKGEIIKSVPSGRDIEEGNIEGALRLGFVSAIGAEEIEKIIMKISEIESVSVRTLGTEKPPENAAAKPVPPEKAGKTASKKDKAGVTQSVRVNIEKIDALMNLVGELVITKIRLDQITREKKFNMLVEAVDEFDRIIDDLQIEVTDVRMLPVSQIFDRYPRVVRDLAAEAGKQVECEITGGDIEIDRTVLEEINEPVMHLVRNAVAHGIETPQQREMAGKAKKGLIRLSARRERNSVIIEVSDDGRGIQVEKVRQKAVEKGIVTRERASLMTPEEIVNLVALPGFSTMEKADQVAGRGVGVDVVKTKVEAFGGVFRIENYEGEGCKFIMKLPLTLAIIQSLLVKCGGAVYAMPVIHTTETIEVPAADVRMIQKKRVIILRGEVLPVVSLAELLKKQRKESDIINLVIVEARDRKIGLEVDSVVGQQEVAIKSLGEFLKYAKGFSGVTILGDGSISLIIDIQALLETGTLTGSIDQNNT